MSRIGFLADVHCANHARFGGAHKAGLNHRCRLVLQTLKRAMARADEVGCGEVHVLGDLLDTTRPLPQVLTAIRDVLHHDCLPVRLMLGNHEQESTADGDHALGPFHGYGEMTVIDKPRVTKVQGSHCWLISIPFQPGPAQVWLPQVLKSVSLHALPKGGQRVLTLHLGIITENTPPFLRDAHDAVAVAPLVQLCKEYEIGAVFAGNWHNRMVDDWDGVAVVQVGALCPTGFDNPGADGYGSLAIYDTEEDEVSWEEIPGPRFMRVQTVAELKALLDAPPETATDLYIRAAVSKEEWAEAQAIMEIGTPIPGAIEVVANEAEVEEAAAKAASQARGAGTLEEALDKYVEAMPLDDGIDRQAVKARARAFLNQAVAE